MLSSGAGIFGQTSLHNISSCVIAEDTKSTNFSRKKKRRSMIFLGTRETNYFKKKFKVRTMRTVYSVERDVIDSIIKKRFVDSEKQLNHFVLDEETNTYEFEVRNKDQLMIIISFVQSSSTFRQTATIMQSLKDAGPLVDIGTIHRSNLSNSVCAIVAVNLQVIKQLLKSMWSFCLAFDGGNNSSDEFISIRIRGELHGNLLNFQLLAIPLIEAGTEEYQFHTRCFRAGLDEQCFWTFFGWCCRYGWTIQKNSFSFTKSDQRKHST